ncbi:transposase [Lactobacillus delbrueckii subsp. jakobsenii ZN7a-9 = DSM 26046]|nr:transposase [Lactobacillus delbrueckii subsp. jakobsenii ZN7a-9 = DSM 26046]
MKAAHLQVKRKFILMDLLKTVFGIDVSSRKSNVCIMVNGQKVNDYAISNDTGGFNQLLDDLKQVTNPQIIFEATGVYSRRLQAFLDMHELRNVMMNPLEAKRKTKSISAIHIGSSFSFKPPHLMELPCRFGTCVKSYCFSAIFVTSIINYLFSLSILSTR